MVAGPEVTSGIGTTQLVKRLSSKNDPASALLAQAVQATSQEAKARRDKRKAKEKDSPLHQLVELLKGKGGSKKKKKKKDRHRRLLHEEVKADPDPPDGSGSSGSSSSSSPAAGRKRGKSDSDSELSFEPPLRKRAMREPGSVMEMLVKHAQQQMDQGSLIDLEAGDHSVVSGIKLATYFALLIRPYHAPGSPLLRELFALAQAMDLLRSGKLPETADALASRFMAVHTALAEGSWATASYLELFPLEPTASASTATMLEAHKHRRLVLKSQGYPATGQWWSGGGRGKASGKADKGRKGDPKGRGGRGKGKGGTKEHSWGSSKGEPNPWKENKEDASKK